MSVINAPASSGKTRVLAEAARAWTQAGLGPVVGIAPSQSARAAESLAVSPGGTRVYVTGSIQGRTAHDFATVAYSAADGTQMWARRYGAVQCLG